MTTSANAATRARRRHLLLGACAWAATLCVACSTPPKEHFYVLALPSTDTAGETARPAPVVVSPVHIPPVVDRPQMVLSTSDNQVMVSEFHRWAEPLDAGIARVLTRAMSRELASPAGAPGAAPLRVSVDVTRFESLLGRSATIEASWSVRDANGARTKSGVVQASEPAPGDHEALAAAHSRALQRMAVEIARALNAG
ncbi:MAG TPA: PqiC family protein [Burkholderiaceae bacterium]|jgi:uncharacterized lipoprotein YmbA|nr:PqiC family protein [Burkholderiaceae bacterium]